MPRSELAVDMHKELQNKRSVGLEFVVNKFTIESKRRHIWEDKVSKRLEHGDKHSKSCKSVTRITVNRHKLTFSCVAQSASPSSHSIP